MTTITAPPAHVGAFDNTGWHVTRHLKGWETDRFMEGPFTVEVEDSYGTTFSVDSIEEMMPWIGDNAVIEYVHGKHGAIALGVILAWKRASIETQQGLVDGIVIRAGVKKGDASTGAGGLIDDIWDQEIKAHGLMGGFSLGGRTIEKTCDARGKACYFNRTDIVEISWTPSPANPYAHLTAVSVARTAAELARGEAGELATVLTAHMHQAYNNFADSLAVNGRLSTEERKAIGNAVGAGLAAVEAGLPAAVAKMVVAGPPIAIVADSSTVADYERSIEEAVSAYFIRNPAAMSRDAAWFQTRCHHCAGFVALLERAGLSEADARRRLETALERARIRARVTTSREEPQVPNEGSGAAPPATPSGTASEPAPPQGTPPGMSNVETAIREGFAKQGKDLQAIQSQLAEHSGRLASLEGQRANAGAARAADDEDEKKKKAKDEEDAKRAAAGKSLTFANEEALVAYVAQKGIHRQIGGGQTPPPPAGNPNGAQPGGMGARKGAARLGTTVRREVENAELVQSVTRRHLDALRQGIAAKPAPPHGGA